MRIGRRRSVTSLVLGAVLVAMEVAWYYCQKLELVVDPVEVGAKLNVAVVSEFAGVSENMAEVTVLSDRVSLMVAVENDELGQLDLQQAIVGRCPNSTLADGSGCVGVEIVGALTPPAGPNRGVVWRALPGRLLHRQVLAHGDCVIDDGLHELGVLLLLAGRRWVVLASVAAAAVSGGAQASKGETTWR